jgi:hypothetical protein
MSSIDFPQPTEPAVELRSGDYVWIEPDGFVADSRGNRYERTLYAPGTYPIQH